MGLEVGEHVEGMGVREWREQCGGWVLVIGRLEEGEQVGICESCGVISGA